MGVDYYTYNVFGINLIEFGDLTDFYGGEGILFNVEPEVYGDSSDFFIAVDIENFKSREYHEEKFIKIFAPDMDIEGFYDFLNTGNLTDKAPSGVDVCKKMEFILSECSDHTGCNLG